VETGSEVVLPIYLLAAIGQIYMAHLLVPLMYTEAFRGATPVFMVAAATTFLGIFWRDGARAQSPAGISVSWPL